MLRYLARLDAARALRSAAFIVSMRQRSALFDAPHCEHASRSSSRGWRSNWPARENAAMCRQGIPDYLITMRAPGECERVTHTTDEYPVDLWQKVASPVWMDINPSDTLQHTSAREHDDERHIAPLQLEVIRRGVMLWSNPGDIVLSPFMGIGSEGFVALQMRRRFVGVELKTSYFAQARANLAAALSKTEDLFFAATTEAA